ncbi:MAG: hypothetical protein Q9213_005212 [Squamulea squamosa]
MNKRPSLIVFGAQSKKPQDKALRTLWVLAHQTAAIRPLLDTVVQLPQLWPLFCEHDSRVSELKPGIIGLHDLANWVSHGESSGISSATCGVVTFPLLVLLHVTYYIHYLQKNSIKHRDLVQAASGAGGIQGFCIGFLTAVVVSGPTDETDLIKKACNAIRLSMAIGVYSDLGAHESGTQSTIVVRLKEKSQIRMVEDFSPSIHIGAILDATTITAVGPESILAAFTAHANRLGLKNQPIHLSCKVHNPENRDLAEVLHALCRRSPELTLGDTNPSQGKVRSNASGQPVLEDSVTHQVIESILMSSCQWHTIMTATADDLLKAGQKTHTFVQIGPGSSIPRKPFESAGLDVNVTSIGSTGALPLLELCNEKSNRSPSHPSLEPIALVGMACRAPGANDVEQLWDVIRSGRSTMVEVPKTRIDISTNYRALQDAKWIEGRKFFGNFVSDSDAFDNTFFSVNSREASAMDPQQRLLLETAYQAVESSGYLHTHRPDRGDKVGVFIGASFVDYEEQLSTHPPSAYTSTGTIRAFLCGRISHYFGWSGPAEVIDTSCSSSLVAVHRACKALQIGECSMAIAGGVNLMATATEFLNLAKAGFLSPTGQCKPFDQAADGYCRGEGVGIVVLKRLSQAEANGDNILAIIPAVATNQSGLSASITIPHSPSQVALYRDILEQARMQGSEIGYVEAHGTGTQAGDPLEMDSIRQVFGGSQRSDKLQIGSIKANIGHLETAAGVISLIKAVLMVNHHIIPPLANHRNLNPKIDSLSNDKINIPLEAQAWKSEAAAICVNSYGAAGSNAALILCQASPRSEKSLPPDDLQEFQYPIVLGAQTKQALQVYFHAIKEHLLSLKHQWKVADVALTLSKRYQRMKFVWSQTCSKTEDFETIITRDEEVFETPKNAKKLVLVFPGQSRRIVACDKTIHDQCHTFRSYIDQCDDMMDQLGYPSITPYIFEPNPISDVVLLHCGTFAVQYACAKSWIDCGLVVDAVIGHSFGELTAIAVAGVISLQDAITFIARRAELLKLHLGSGCGSMVAIHTDADEVSRSTDSVTSSGDSLEIACYNSQANHVVSGPKSLVERLSSSLRHDLKQTKLDINYAFHSSLLDPLLEELTAVAKMMGFCEPEIPIETCTEVPIGSIDASRLVKHTREPVWFHTAVQRLENRLGECVWLEAGMGSSIIPTVKRASADPGHHYFQSLTPRTPQDGMLQLAEVTKNLWRQGCSPVHWAFQEKSEAAPKQIWLPPYQFEKTRHWIPYVDNAMKILSERPLQGAAILQEKADTITETLITPLAEGKYSINIASEYYRSIVMSHSVLGRPLCPAAMYLECATMAVQSTNKLLQGKSLSFQDLTIDAPLGVDSRRDVYLQLEKRPEEEAWYFSVTSQLREDVESSSVSHGKGVNAFEQPKGSARSVHYERLIKERISFVRANDSCEVLKHNRAYGLFSHVVNYGDNLRGINSISLIENESIAEVSVPPRISAESSTAGSICDTAVLDNFIQVAGLSLNTSEDCGAEEVFVAVGIKDALVLSGYDLTDSTAWTVYTSYTIEDGAFACADVAVLSADRGLAITMNDIKFAKLPIKRLRKLLERANEGSDNSTSKPDIEMNSHSPIEDRKGLDAASSHDESAQIIHRLQDSLKSVLELSNGEIPTDVPLGDLGMDSLAATEIADTLQSQFKIEEDLSGLPELTFGNICSMLGNSCGTPDTATLADSTISQTDNVLDSVPNESGLDKPLPGPGTQSNPMRSSEAVAPLTALHNSSLSVDRFASERAFSQYWSTVAPRQDRIAAAHITQAFRRLGVDLCTIQSGQSVRSPEVLPKYSQVLQRFWQILEQLGIVHVQGPSIIRTEHPLSLEPADSLSKELCLDFPAFKGEIDLMELTGPQLAECLTGRTDATKILFANSRSQEIMRAYYTESPPLAIATDLLGDFIRQILPRKDTEKTRILEAGAGFGGTTAPLMKLLDSVGCKVSYTFTDVSPRLVKAAKSSFSTYPWMDFQVLNLESDPPSSLREKYDLILGTNVVHATSNVVETCTRLRTLLRDNGIIALSEITCKINWYDIVFGLLDGWWNAIDGRDYPLQRPDYWIRAFKNAGFSDCAVSGGVGAEAETQKIIIGCKASQPQPDVDCHHSNPSTDIVQEESPGKSSERQTVGPALNKSKQSEMETVVYKKVDDVFLKADISYPKSRGDAHGRPIVLMIHGGGHMILSRKDVRPWQTKYVLDNGMLPVSIDYRLCPEINLVDGAMSDVCDALSWARAKLPDIAKAHGVSVDPGKVAVMGWSTGATLAMSAAWTASAAGKEPPSAILAFYGPSDYEAQGKLFFIPIPNLASPEHNP